MLQAGNNGDYFPLRLKWKFQKNVQSANSGTGKRTTLTKAGEGCCVIHVQKKKIWRLLGGVDALLMNLKSLTVLNSMSEASLLWLTFQSWSVCCIRFCFRVPLISGHRVNFCSKPKQVADSRASVCHSYLKWIFFFSPHHCCVTRRVRTSPAELLSLHLGYITLTQLWKPSQNLRRDLKGLLALVQDACALTSFCLWCFKWGLQGLLW